MPSDRDKYHLYLYIAIKAQEPWPKFAEIINHKLTSLTLKMALYFNLHAERLRTSGCATNVFWWIGALEKIVYNQRSIANFGNLNVFLLYQLNLLGGDIW